MSMHRPWMRRLLADALQPRLKFKFLRNPVQRWRIVRGDQVQVISGPHQGKQGKVLRVLRTKQRVLVQGVNLHDKRVYDDRGNFIRNRPTHGSIHYSNVMLVCPVTGLPTKTARRFKKDGTPVRVAKRSGAIIPKPERPKKELNLSVGPKDTAPDDVLDVTFDEYDKYLPFMYSDPDRKPASA